jgi:CheY-like chemotaxis protein
MQIRAPAPIGASAASTVVLALGDRERRRAIEKVLAGDGTTVLEADDGTAALALARDRSPKLLILDATLPAVTGWEVARRLVADGKGASVAVVVLSDIAKDWRLTEDLRETYGVRHVLDATIDPAKLAEVVRLELDGKPYPPPPPALSPDAEARWTAGIAAFEQGNLDRAIEEMEAGVRIDAGAFEMHYHLGLLHGRRDDLFAAIRALDRAVALQPKSFAALKNLAVVCQRAGLRRRARDSWERALSAAPDESTAATIRQHIASGLL